MWRKTDIKKRWQALYPAPQNWKEPFIQASPEIDSRGKKFVRATVVDRTSTEIASTVLDPDVVTLSSLIEAGVTIDPKFARSLLNITDPADLEKYNTERSNNLYNYLLNNQDEIKEQLKK